MMINLMVHCQSAELQGPGLAMNRARTFRPPIISCNHCTSSQDSRRHCSACGLRNTARDARAQAFHAQTASGLIMSSKTVYSEFKDYGLGIFLRVTAPEPMWGLAIHHIVFRNFIVFGRTDRVSVGTRQKIPAVWEMISKRCRKPDSKHASGRFTKSGSTPLRPCLLRMTLM